MKNLKDKIVLITGASSGIGEGCAHKFADTQAKLILVARRLDRLEKLAAELPTQTYLIKLDIRNQADVEKAINELPKEWSDIDILINNAGLSRGLEKFHECKISGWDEMIDTNVKGLLYVSRAVTPNMVKRGSGQVINIGTGIMTSINELAKLILKALDSRNPIKPAYIDYDDKNSTYTII